MLKDSMKAACYTLPIRNWDVSLGDISVTVSMSRYRYTLPIRNWDSAAGAGVVSAAGALYLTYKELRHLERLQPLVLKYESRYTLPIRNWDDFKIECLYGKESCSMLYLTYKELRRPGFSPGWPWPGFFTCYTLPIRNWDITASSLGMASLSIELSIVIPYL